MSMTTEEKNTLMKKMSEEADGLINRARVFARSLFDQEKYTEYLLLMSKFHRYSFINILLIHQQFPPASYISGFDTWKMVAQETYNNPSYQILLKQYFGKGIKILIPFTPNILYGTTSDPKKRRLIYYPVSVYDVKQTNKLPPVETDPLDIEIINRHLIAALFSDGPYRFVLTGKTDKFIRSGMGSYFDNVNQFIVIDDALSENERIFEYIQTWAKKDISDFIKQKGINESYSGFILASAEFVIRSAFCLNTGDITFNYVPQYASANENEFWYVLYCIQAVSHVIIERLTDGILDRYEEAKNNWADEETLFDFDFSGDRRYEV